MKIIQIMDTLGSSGGVNTFVFDLCEALKLNGHDVALIGILSKGMNDNPDIERLRKLGIQVECVGAKSKKDAMVHNVGKLKKIIKSITKKDMAVCNLHLKLGVLMGVMATVGERNIYCVETYHNTYHYYHLQCWCCSPFIKKYICVSDEAKKEMKRRFFISDTRIVAIPNGISRKKIRNLSRIDFLDSNKEQKTQVVSVGRLSYEKNFKIVVEAMTECCSNHITYTLVGGGPQEEEIREIARNNPYIKILGAQSRERTLQELAKADIVIMPSLWEGRSILQLEAMALDKPMILSDVPGLREPFKENPLAENENYRISKFGYLVKTKEKEVYCNVVEDFACHKERRTVIGDYIQNVSMQNDISKTATKYYSVYIDILSHMRRNKKIRL